VTKFKLRFLTTTKKTARSTLALRLAFLKSRSPLRKKRPKKQLKKLLRNPESPALSRKKNLKKIKSGAKKFLTILLLTFLKISTLNNKIKPLS
jgi:hypothetical protein